MEIDEKIKQEIRELLNRVTRADYDDDKISNFDYYIDDPKELVTLKNELAELRRKAGKYDKDTALDEAERDRFIKLMDAEQGKDRADAEKWRKVKEIAKRNWYDGYPCDGCPVENCCDSADSLCGQADALVQALTGKEPR